MYCTKLFIKTSIAFFITADIISCVEFNHDGDLLATGDKGGRVVIFQRDPIVSVIVIYNLKDRQILNKQTCVKYALSEQSNYHTDVNDYIYIFLISIYLELIP